MSKNEKAAEPMYEITDEQMVNIPSPRKSSVGEWDPKLIKVQKSRNGNMAQVNWDYISQGLDAAERIAKAYIARVYPNGIDAAPETLSEGERRVLGSAYARDNNGLGQQFGLDHVSKLCKALFYANCYANELYMHGTVLMSRNVAKELPED